MKRGIIIIALLLLVGGIGGGGYYLIQYGLPGEATPRGHTIPPIEATIPPPEELPVPELAW